MKTLRTKLIVELIFFNSEPLWIELRISLNSCIAFQAITNQHEPFYDEYEAIWTAWICDTIYKLLFNSILKWKRFGITSAPELARSILVHQSEVEIDVEVTRIDLTLLRIGAIQVRWSLTPVPVTSKPRFSFADPCFYSFPNALNSIHLGSAA